MCSGSWLRCKELGANSGNSQVSQASNLYLAMELFIYTSDRSGSGSELKGGVYELFWTEVGSSLPVVLKLGIDLQLSHLVILVVESE